MPFSFLNPHGTSTPQEFLHLAQQAPIILRKYPKSFPASPIAALISPTSESGDVWITYEKLLMACLVTRDITSAHECLARLLRRFGGDNDRVLALKGLIKETEAKCDADLEEILHEYESILTENATNIPVAKRCVSVLKLLHRVPDAISALLKLLDTSPTDIEAWSELSDLYLFQGLYAQAIFALEEVLLLKPNDPNLHAQMGEVLMMAAIASPADDTSPFYLAESLKRQCRCVELSNTSLRGYYGLKLVSDRLLDDPTTRRPGRGIDTEAVMPTDSPTIEKLNELAILKLGEIVRRYRAGDPLWQAYDQGEVAAARGLLERTAAIGPK